MELQNFDDRLRHISVRNVDTVLLGYVAVVTLDGTVVCIHILL